MLAVTKQFLERRLLVCALFVLLAAAPVARAAPVTQPPAPAATPSICTQNQAFELPGGALGLVCKPTEGWNGDVIVYAHGYVDPTETQRVFANLEFPQPSGPPVSLPTLIQQLGYGFAATTYRRNGLAVLEGVQDIRELVATLPEKLQTAPRRVFVLGISEGGLVATLFGERYPLASDGVLAACGPIGDFKRQITYFGDFRALFDFYFPDALPASATTIPTEVITNWDSKYVPAITKALNDDSTSTNKLIVDSGATIDPASPIPAILGILRYNVFSTNDAKAQLGGNPYDSSALIARFPSYGLKQYTADAAATRALDAYQTSGRIALPLITAHTTGDEIVPVQQQDLYKQKAQNNGFASYRTFTRYGHCTFQGSELLSAFIELAQRGAQLRRVYLPLL